MRQLDADRSALSPHEGDQRLETLDLRFIPDAEVAFVGVLGSSSSQGRIL